MRSEAGKIRSRSSIFLLALAEHGRGPAEEAFFALGVSPTAASALPVPLPEAEPSHSPPFSPGARRVPELSLRESRQLRHAYVGSEHLLLGVLQHLDDPWAEREPASEFLEQLGVEVEQMRRALLIRMPD